MRGFVIGLIVIVGLSVSILSVRPGGLRRQLGFAARRFRIALVLGGIWVFASLVIRFAFPSGPVADYGPAVVGVILAAVFVFLGRDPNQAAGLPRR